MDLVQIIAEVLKYVIPAGMVLVAVWFVMKGQESRLTQVQQAEIRAEVLKQHLPLKFVAYERAILFLERIQPEHLLTRTLAGEMTVEWYRLELVREIREEFEHNLAQQLYISPAGWQMLVQAKNEVITLIHQVAGKLQKDDEGRKLARLLLEEVGKKEGLLAGKAIFVLKKDVASWFEMNQD